MVLTLYRYDGEGRGEPTPLMIGEYEDVYQRCDDLAWRFAERRLSVIFGT